MAGRVDAGDHLGIRLIAIAQNGNSISALGGTARNALRRILKRRHVVIVTDFAAGSRERRGGARHAHGKRAPSHAVDSQKYIQEAAQNRRQPRYANPGCSRAWIALMNKYVGRNTRRQQQVQHGEYRRARRGEDESLQQCGVFKLDLSAECAKSTLCVSVVGRCSAATPGIRSLPAGSCDGGERRIKGKICGHLHSPARQQESSP